MHMVVRIACVGAALGVASAVVQAQAYRYVVDGKSVYQQAPCAQGAAGEVKGAPAAPPTPARQALPVAAPVETKRAAEQPPPAAPAAATKTWLETEADQCLEWYRPRLRDPRGAYYTSPSKEQRVLTIVIHATNGFGGFVTKRAQCEVLNGRLDSDWTAIHARDGGWR